MAYYSMSAIFNQPINHVLLKAPNLTKQKKVRMSYYSMIFVMIAIYMTINKRNN